MVIFDIGQMLRAAVAERASIFAEETEDVPEGPRIIGRLDGEEGHFDEEVIVFSEHAFPFLILVCSNAFLGGQVYLLVRYLHEVLELQLVVVALGDIVGGVEEDAGVRQRDDSGGSRCMLGYIVSPQEGSKTACGLASHDDVSC